MNEASHSSARSPSVGIRRAAAHPVRSRATRQPSPDKGKPRDSEGIPGEKWRWGESNPRPVAGPEFFSERSLRIISRPPASCRPATG